MRLLRLWGGSFDAPSLSVSPTEAASHVVYSSSETSVATISTEGEVEIIGAGTTTITAEIPATDDTYEATSASYTLNVSASASGDDVIYELVTDASTLTYNDKLIIGCAEHNVAMSSSFISTSSSNYAEPTSATFSNNSIINPSTNVQILTLKGSAGAWLFEVGTDAYLTCGTTSAKLYNNGSSTSGLASISIESSGDATITFLEKGTDATNTIIKYNNSAPRFAGYKSTSTMAMVQLYRLVDNRTTTSLAWSAETASAVIGETPTLPTLNVTPAEAAPLVQYSSSYPLIATIDANGNVTINEKGAIGTTTISAWINDDDNTYKGCPVASYELTVSEPEGDTYYRLVTDVSKLNDGDKLLFVHPDGTNSKAMSATENYTSSTGRYIRRTANVTVDNDLITNPFANIIEGTGKPQIIILEKADGVDGEWQFNVGTGHLAATGGTTYNSLQTIATTDETTHATISINPDSNYEATITFTGVTGDEENDPHNILKYVLEGFACYVANSDSPNFQIYARIPADQLGALGDIIICDEDGNALTEGAVPNYTAIQASCEGATTITMTVNGVAVNEMPYIIDKANGDTFAVEVTASNDNSSTTASATFTIQAAATPTFSIPDGSSVQRNSTVTISSEAADYIKWQMLNQSGRILQEGEANASSVDVTLTRGCTIVATATYFDVPCPADATAHYDVYTSDAAEIETPEITPYVDQEYLLGNHLTYTNHVNIDIYAPNGVVKYTINDGEEQTWTGEEFQVINDGESTITAWTENADDTQESATATITVSKFEKPADCVEYMPVTSATQLVAGHGYLLGAWRDGVFYCMSQHMATTNDQIMPVEASQAADGNIYLDKQNTHGHSEFYLGGNATDGWYFWREINAGSSDVHDSEAKYLCTDKNSNALYIKDLDDTTLEMARVSIALQDATATVAAEAAMMSATILSNDISWIGEHATDTSIEFINAESKAKLAYNYNSGDPRFGTYASPTQSNYSAIRLYTTGSSITTGVSVNTITIDNDHNAPVEYYNLQGQRITNPQPGTLYIQRQGTKINKVIYR